MLRVTVALGLVATVGCRQPLPPQAAAEQPAQASALRAAIVQAESPRNNKLERVSKVRGRPIAWCAEPRIFWCSVERGS